MKLPEIPQGQKEYLEFCLCHFIETWKTTLIGMDDFIEQISGKFDFKGTEDDNDNIGFIEDMVCNWTNRKNIMNQIINILQSTSKFCIKKIEAYELAGNIKTMLEQLEYAKLFCQQLINSEKII